MTPKEEFAAKRLEAESLIQKHAPERLQEQLISLLRPAIALTATRADDTHIPVGASKFGGAPDVPADFKWPMWNEKPLGFLAQINLEEVAPFDVEGLLPKNGLLSFFALDRKHWPDEMPVASWKVLWFNEELQRAFVADYGAARMDFQINIQDGDLQFSPYRDLVTVSNEDDDYYYKYPELEPFRAAWEKARFWIPQNNNAHQLLGEAWLNTYGWMQCLCESQSTNQPFRAVEYSPEAARWTLLLQLNSDYHRGMSWNDAGLASFWIRHEDLSAQQFERAWMELQFT